jgi:hypothetical protein
MHFSEKRLNNLSPPNVQPPLVHLLKGDSIAESSGCAGHRKQGIIEGPASSTPVFEQKSPEFTTFPQCDED